MSEHGLALATGVSLRDGRYSIEAVIGHGGFGITYRAVDTMLTRRVAIKEFFLAGSSRAGAGVHPPPNLEEAFIDRRDRIRDEARVLARFRHPNIVTVHEFFEENGTIYVVMELLEGRSLQRVLSQAGGWLPEEEAIRYATEIGSALDAVHAEGLLHRDVKPANVMVVGDGRAVLVDFGTAREFALGQSSPMSQTLTPGYAPVEQYTARGHFGPATDVYAFGATVYHMVTGAFPVPSLDRYAGQELPPPRQVNPAVSARVSEAIMAAMAVDSEQRPASAGDFAAMLSGARPAERRRAHRPDETVVVKEDAGPATGGDRPPVRDDGFTVGAGTEPETWLSWPVRIAAVVAVLALGASVFLIGLLMFGDDGGGPPPPPDTAEATWTVSTGAALTAAPGDAAPVATLEPGPVSVTGAVAEVGSAAYLEVRHPLGTGWVAADFLHSPGDEELAEIEFRLKSSPLAVAISQPGSWTALSRTPVKAAPDSGSRELFFFRVGDELQLTGDVASTGAQTWGFAASDRGNGWVRADRLDLEGQPAFLDVPRGQGCADLVAAQLDYPQAVAYWLWDGRPASLDADQNGRPCEAEYPADEIDRYRELIG